MWEPTGVSITSQQVFKQIGYMGVSLKVGTIFIKFRCYVHYLEKNYDNNV